MCSGSYSAPRSWWQRIVDDGGVNDDDGDDNDLDDDHNGRDGDDNDLDGDDINDDHDHLHLLSSSSLSSCLELSLPSVSSSPLQSQSRLGWW